MYKYAVKTNWMTVVKLDVGNMHCSLHLTIGTTLTRVRTGDFLDKFPYEYAFASSILLKLKLQHKNFNT